MGCSAFFNNNRIAPPEKLAVDCLATHTGFRIDGREIRILCGVVGNKTLPPVNIRILQMAATLMRGRCCASAFGAEYKSTGVDCRDIECFAAENFNLYLAPYSWY